LCKHTLNVAAKAKRKFPAAMRDRPWKPDRFTLSLTYGLKLTLRLEGPDRSRSPEIAEIVGDYLGKEWDTPEQFERALNLCRMLERAGEDVIIYPDAEEVHQPDPRSPGRGAPDERASGKPGESPAAQDAPPGSAASLSIGWHCFRGGRRPGDPSG